MADINIILKVKIEQEQTDCRECVLCEEIIYSDMYRIYLVQAGGHKTETRLAFCKSCNDMIF